MSNSVLFKNAEALLWSSSKGWHLEKTSIYSVQGKIQSIGSACPAAADQIVDMTGLTVLPGLIDSQVHFREPGFTHKEDLATGTKAAALGGVTTIFEMPNTNPATTSLEALNEKFERAKGRCYVNYAFFSGGAQGNAEQVALMQNHPNSPGLKIFMGSSFGPMLVDSDEALAQLLNVSSRRVTVHCEDEAILNHNKAQLPPNPSVSLHCHWRSPESGLAATTRLVNLARKLGKQVHVLHITSKEEILFLKDNADVASFEILPQHLTLFAPDCYQLLGSKAQQNPPIREKEHQDMLWKAIENKWVTTLGSDHAPHTLEEKAKPYPQSPSGVPGVQTIVPIMLNHVHQGKLSLSHFVELMTLGVVKTFGLQNKGLIQVGYDADFTVVDLNKKVQISNNMMATKCGWTPFDGMWVTGFPIMTWVAGQCIMQEGELLTPPLGTPAYFK